MSKLYVNEIVEATAGAGVHVPGAVVQVQRIDYGGNLGSYTSTSYTNIGGSYFRNTFTPKYASSLLKVTLEAQCYITGTPNPYGNITIYRDGVNQLTPSYGFGYIQAVGISGVATTQMGGTIDVNANSTSSTVFEMWAAAGSGYTLNFGNSSYRSLTVTEIAQ